MDVRQHITSPSLAASPTLTGHTSLRKTDKQVLEDMLHRSFESRQYRTDGLDIVTHTGVRFIFDVDGGLCSVKPDYK